MRVLVASDRLAGLDPRGASELLGREFAAVGAQVAVLALSAGGEDYRAAVALFQPEAVVARPRDLAELLEVLRRPAPLLHVDLTATVVPDIDDLVAAVDSDVARALHASHDIVGIVPGADVGMALTGLSGWIAEEGRTVERDLGDTLARAARAERWAAPLPIDPEAAGAGARGGLGSLVQLAGGRLSSGVEECLRGFAALEVMRRADLVVTGSDVLDFHRVGGDVVKQVAELAEQALRPAIAVVGRNFVSARELRQVGLETAYPALDGFGSELATPAQVAAVAQRVAATWRW